MLVLEIFENHVGHVGHDECNRAPVGNMKSHSPCLSWFSLVPENMGLLRGTDYYVCGVAGVFAWSSVPSEFWE